MWWIPLSLVLLAGCSASRSTVAIGGSRSAGSATHAMPSASDASDVSLVSAVRDASDDVPAGPLGCLDESAARSLACVGLTRAQGASTFDASRFDALFAQRAQRGATRGDLDFAPRALDERASQLVSMGIDFVCASSPSAQESSVRYRVARVLYESNQLTAAAAHFRAMLFRPADVRIDRELRTFAADLYLDSLSILASRVEPRRPACLDVMREDLPRLRALLCSARSRESDEFCARSTVIQCQLEARERGVDPGACRSP